MKLFEDIRHEYEHGACTIIGVSKKLGVHRRTVRKALECSLPPERKPVSRPSPLLDAVSPFIDGILEADKGAPRKQRHTAHRIWVRLCTEHPEHTIAESTVRAYVRARKAQIGPVRCEVFIAQCYQWGVEAQCDWYEAFAEIAGEQVKVQVFALRSMKSGGAFHRAYLKSTQQAFFEAHEHAFAYFGGVFQLIRYDNLASAVKKIVRGCTREENIRFTGFRSHWGFNSEFCTPREPHEKGGVEGEVGRGRRNIFVPVPKVKDLDELNELLLQGCRADEDRVAGNRASTVGTLMGEERRHLLPLPVDRFEIIETVCPKVDTMRCVTIRRVRYSTPLRPGSQPTVKVSPSHVEIWSDGKKVAVHERCYIHGEGIYDLDHYLDVLERKPGALPGSVALAQRRAAGLWPQSLDILHELWQRNYGNRAGTRALVDLICLAPRHGWQEIQRAADQAVELGCIDASAVKCLLTQGDQSGQTCLLTPEDLGILSNYERPAPQIDGYDRLLVLTRKEADAA